DLGILHTPAHARCAGDEVIPPAAGEVQFRADRRLAGWPATGFYGGDRRQRATLGARARFKRSQGALRDAERGVPPLVARQPPHRLLRRRPAQEDRGHWRARTKPLLFGGTLLRGLGPRPGCFSFVW